MNKTATFPVAVSPQVDVKKTKAAYIRISIAGCERSENGAGIYTFKVFND